MARFQISTLSKTGEVVALETHWRLNKARKAAKAQLKKVAKTSGVASICPTLAHVIQEAGKYNAGQTLNLPLARSIVTIEDLKPSGAIREARI